jgi:ABC-type transport system involved in multi-copper enzyme maturation permease subunit
MTMLRFLLKRQLVDDLTSFRFAMYAIIVLSGIIAFAFVFSGLHRDRTEQFSRSANESERQLRAAASSFVSLIRESEQTIGMEPRAAQFIADGREGQMPRSLSVSVPGVLLKAEADDPGTAILSAPDLTSLIQIVFSFFALVLTFSAISFERERGTLRLVLSNAVMKSEVLLSKYLGALLTIAAPLAAGLILGLIVLYFGGLPVFSGGFVIPLILFLAISLFYLSFFILLGLFCSITGKSSKNSLVLGLLAWVFFVIILPKAASPLLGLARFDVPTENAIYEEARAAERAVWDSHKDENLVTGSPDAESTKLNVKVMNEAARAKQGIRDLYLDKKIHAVRSLMSVNCISPAALLEYAASAAAGTGLSHFERFRLQIGRYRDDLINFYKAQDLKDGVSPHLVFHPDYVSKKPVAFESIPRFKEQEPSLAGRVKDAAWYGAGLILYNIIMFGLVFISFQRYDVR